MCEAIFGLVEHAVLQKSYVPRDAWKHCWRPYALERLRQSKELDKFFDPNEHYYSHKMCREIKSLRRELEKEREAKARQAFGNTAVQSRRPHRFELHCTGMWPDSAQEVAEQPGARVVPLLRDPYSIFYRNTGETIEIRYTHPAAQDERRNI